MNPISIILFVFKWLFLALLVILIYFSINPLWNKWVVYPRMDRDIQSLVAQYRQPLQIIPSTDFQGALHAHTYWSHDSRGTLEEILPAAKAAKLDFVFFSDHKRNALDTFPRSIQGVYDGVLFEPGTESNLLMVNPLRDTVIDWDMDQDELIKEVTEAGGLVLYLHTEEPHNWSNPHYQGMEIYNIHTDLLDEDGLLPFLLNSVVNGRKHKHWTYRALFDEQIEILALWDSLNQHRKIIGYGAPDVHNNQSIRARYMDDGKVEWVGPNAKTLAIVQPGWKERLLLGVPDEGGWAFKAELDTYFHSFNYVQTHIFSDTLSAIALKENLVAGHAFVSFENLLEAKGFQYFAKDNAGNLSGILGDSIPLARANTLEVVSPFPVTFELVKDGAVIETLANAYTFEHRLAEKGNYRIVANIPFNKGTVPWVYTNAIYVY